MNFPSVSQYNEVVQHPTLYFTDADVEQRQVQTDALGVPEALSGGFAYVYRFTGLDGDIAVRCFHREVPELFERYRAISAFLASLGSHFFVYFEFTERGVCIDGIDLPVVWMSWVEGETLLEYISHHRSDPGALEHLREQLLIFAEEAESRGYAHGDIQHRNLMVTTGGILKLVDYDSMYVPALQHLQAADEGHPHFQLPSRTAADFSSRMDRFSLAVVDLSLEALQEAPNLFDQFHDGENLIFSYNDFLNPAASAALNAVARIPRLVSRVAAFSDLCGLSVREMPPLREFRASSRLRPITQSLPTGASRIWKVTRVSLESIPAWMREGDASTPGEWKITRVSGSNIPDWMREDVSGGMAKPPLPSFSRSLPKAAAVNPAVNLTRRPGGNLIASLVTLSTATLAARMRAAWIFADGRWPALVIALLLGFLGLGLVISISLTWDLAPQAAFEVNQPKPSKVKPSEGGKIYQLDRIYRYAGPPSFTVGVPDGWEANTTKLGIQLKDNKGISLSVMSFEMKDIGPAIAVISKAIIEFRESGFQEAERGRVPLGDYSGVYIVCSKDFGDRIGILRLVATSHGSQTYVTVTEGFSEAYDGAKRSIEKVEASFLVEPMPGVR